MNSIAERIADFLVNYAPFSELTFDELTKVATDIRVFNLEKNQILFQINDHLHDCFYVVANGIINLSVISDAEETLLNKCHSGDILGLRPFFAKNNYMMTAKAREESLVYAIPIATFRPFVANNSEVLDFLLQSFASTAPGNNNQNSKRKLINDSVQYTDNQSEMQFFQTLNYHSNPILTPPTAIIQNVAQAMTDKLLGCAIVHQNKMPIGIITDFDLRSKIANGRFNTATLAQNIMSSPVFCVPENLSLAEAQLFMLRQNVSYLCVTIDGTDKTEVRGIVTQHDLIEAQSNNPGVLIKEIKRATNQEELKILREKLSEFVRTSLDKKIPLQHIYSIAGEVIFAIIKRAIDLTILDLGSPPARFAWFSIGSQARKEQLLPTDQDSFLIFDDVAADKYREVKNYFLKLAKKTTSILEFCGFPICPNSHIASHPNCCKSITDWTKQFQNWINTPGENTEDIESIFFDFELVLGDIKIEENLTSTILNQLKTKQKFLAFLGNSAIKKPAALSFFKQFNTEEEGPFKDFFDIKNRAITPIVDAARLLILSHEISGFNNTYLRFKQLAIIEPKYEEIYLGAAESFLTLSKFRTIEGIKNGTNGQYIDLLEMSKSDKEKLKNCFQSTKDLEEIIKNKFQLTYFS